MSPRSFPTRPSRPAHLLTPLSWPHPPKPTMCWPGKLGRRVVSTDGEPVQSGARTGVRPAIPMKTPMSKLNPNVIILTSGISGSSVLTGLISRAGYWTGDNYP